MKSRIDFRIADTFTDSLARLTGEEQKAVKTTAFDLQLNPAAPGLPTSTWGRHFFSVQVTGSPYVTRTWTTGSVRCPEWL